MCQLVSVQPRLNRFDRLVVFWVSLFLFAVSTGSQTCVVSWRGSLDGPVSSDGCLSCPSSLACRVPASEKGKLHSLPESTADWSNADSAGSYIAHGLTAHHSDPRLTAGIEPVSAGQAVS